MERNQIIGFILIFATLFVWTYLSKPDAAELERRKRVQDSLARIEAVQDSLNTEAYDNTAPTNTTPTTQLPDSLQMVANSAAFGAFTPASIGEEQEYTLENEDVKITFNNKGGKITSVFLKKHVKTIEVDGRPAGEEPVIMLNDKRNKFEYLIPVANTASGAISTEDLYFQVNQSGNKITFSAPVSTGGSFIQEYTLGEGYDLDYVIDYSGLANVLDKRSNSITFNWENYLNSYELNRRFEQQYSAVYYKKDDDNHPKDCGCTSDETDEIDEDKIDWVAHANQYFNTAIIAKNASFTSGIVSSEAPENEDADYIEKLTSTLEIPTSANRFEMDMYIGPNDYETLQSYDVSLEDVIPYGNSLFGTINRYLIRPLFDFFSGLVGNLGLAIIFVIFLIKMALYPLMYKMLHSQALMGALKPRLAHLNDKYKDDMQKKQMETMKIYREYGVSPLGGCMPMLIQMPIWYALFRFFPASLTFRQEPFLWAHDLSSYDAFFHLPFSIPFMGDHLSLFTILWAASTLIYTYYNTKHMDMSANPAMKYMQYFMPIMFLGFFNTYASALTCYMFFSNLINILQTVITKRFVFNDEKLLKELDKKKAKPKKKGGFQQRLEEAMRQQQEIQAKKNKK